MASNTKRAVAPVAKVELEVDALKLALRRAFELGQEAPVKKILLVTPVNDQLRYSTLAEVLDALGSNIGEALLADRVVQLPAGVQLAHESMRTFRPTWDESVILAVYADKEMQNRADACSKAYGVVVVPTIRDGGTLWIRTWNPEILGNAAAADQKKLIDNPVVERALEMLNDDINVHNNLVTSYDRGSAVQLLRALRDAGERYDPAALRAWAIREGWLPEGAKNLEDIADRIQRGSPLRSGPARHWPADIVKRIRSELRPR